MSCAEFPVWAQEFIWAVIISITVLVSYVLLIIIFYKRRKYIEYAVKYIFAIGAWLKLMIEKLHEGAIALGVTFFDFKWYYYLVAAAVVVIVNTTMDTEFVSGKVNKYMEKIKAGKETN